MTGPPRYQQVASDLRRRITAAEFATQLPPESRLLADYRISEGTLRPALLILELEGLITRHQGGQHQVRPAPVVTLVVVDVPGPVDVTARPATDAERDDMGLPMGAWVLVVWDVDRMDEHGQPTVWAVYPAAGTRLRIGEPERPDPA